MTEMVVFAHNVSAFLDIEEEKALNFKSLLLGVSGIPMTVMVANLSLFFLVLAKIVASTHNMSDFLDIELLKVINFKSLFAYGCLESQSGYKSFMCYDHNKCRFQYYNGLLSKSLIHYSSQKKSELNQAKNQNIHSFLCTNNIESCEKQSNPRTI